MEIAGRPSPSSLSSAGRELELSGEPQEGVFAWLRPYCLELLELLRSPRGEAPFLADMAEFLGRAPPGLLQPCLDYTLLPLLLLLDAAIQGRSQQTAKSEGILGSGNTFVKRHMISDIVAEDVLRCLEELLSKCQLTSVDQMAMVLKKLALGASLSPSEAAEEFREGIIRCARSTLLLLEPCSSESCTCKQVARPTCVPTSILQGHVTSTSEYHSESEECLLAFLQSPSASAAVGHWLSLLLQAAETEAERGLRGSAKLRKEAFLTLRVLIAKVGSADALAFFLPGVVSRFTKALYVTKSMISGAAGSVGSIDHAIRGLTEFLVIVLRDEANASDLMPVNNNGLCFERHKSSESVLEALRQLHGHAYVQGESSAEPLIDPSVHLNSFQLEKNSHSEQIKSLYVRRTKAWIEETSLRVDQLLSAVFPHLCTHPAEKVRQGVIESIRGILLNCCITLKRSKLMLLECLCALVCDDSDAVCVDAQEAFESLFMFKEKYFTETELAEMLNRLVEILPRVVLGSEETFAVQHAQKLLALMYYTGPDFVVDHLLHPPVRADQFLELLGSSLSQSSLYSGSMDKLILTKPLSIGYLHSVAELKAASLFGISDFGITSGCLSGVPKISFVQDTDINYPQDAAYDNYELPRIPPWFLNLGSEKLYIALAGILRLLGLAVTAEHRSDVSLSLVIDSPLQHFRKLISEIRMKGYTKENWQSWYSRSGSGLLVRQTSTAACVLNEIIYGTSERSAGLYAQFFGKSKSKIRTSQENQDELDSNLEKWGSVWKYSHDAKEQVIHCIGSILHEYLSPEIWDLPVDQNSTEGETLSLHFLRDAIMLHQVIVEGIGIFNVSLGKHFIESGFMHSSLFLLLQKLICSSNQIKSASDAVLHVVTTASGYPTVGHLVVSNADYIIDSLCRQLRHLDLNPHIPDVLAAMLSYIGAAHEILPLLEEPMRSVSTELEVLSRNQHPALTIPFLKAVGEITRASRREAFVVADEAESFYMRVKDKNPSAEKHEKEKGSVSTISYVGPLESGKTGNNCVSGESRLEYWEDLLPRLNEMKRYRHIVGSIAESCLKAATPLLASAKESACLAVLNIIEDGTMALAKVEDAYKHEKETRQVIEREIQLCSFRDPQDVTDTSDEGIDENRLLPTMNKIWPYLVICVKNRTSVAVIRRCMSVLSTTVQICGGDFFIRRFRTEGSCIWKLLATSPFQKPLPCKDERPILLPYRASASSEDSMSEVSSLKVQEAVLNMVAEISANKRSASAVEAVLKKVSSLVVGIACSGVSNLQESSVKALSGLACIDPDLIWLLLADVLYSIKHKDVPLPPTSDFADISLLLPPPSSTKEYLYVRYGGEGSGYNLDPSAVDKCTRECCL